MAAAIRVLYVDDEPTVLDVGRILLEQSGNFSIATAESAPAALELLKNEHFDAIVSDFEMPGMDGIRFLVEVRTRFGPVPFIMFTGKGEKEEVIQAINNGTDFYLEKGDDPEIQFVDLSHKIKQAVSRRRADEALRETNEYLNNLFDYANAPIIVWDPEFVITRFNPAFEELTLRSKQEVIGKPLDILFPKESTDSLRILIKKALEGERWETVEIPILTKDGSVRLVLWNSANVLDPEGRIVSSIAQGIDITERKRAEEALRESEERFRTIILSMQFGIVIIDAQTHTILDANHKALEMIGSRNEDVVGSVCQRFICPAESGRCPVTDLGQTGDSSERVLLNVRGEKIPILKSVIRTTLGGREVLIESFVDITERKRAEEEIIFKNILLSTQQETSLDGILIVNENGKILNYNQRFIDIWDIPDDVLASQSDERALQSITEKLVDPESFLARVNYLYSYKAEKSHEEILLKDGRIMDRHSAPMFGKTGTYYGRVWYFQDITERKRAEEALQTLTRELESRVLQRTSELEQEIVQRKTAEETVTKSLLEKEVLLREIHHRVKNNLQIITSLIRLQKQQITDAGTIDALLDSESRIRSMALVHEKLYRSADLASIDLTDYTRTLATHLITTYATDPTKIRLVIDIKEVFLDINRATPVGLIMNELITNTLTHAFPEGRSGEITITGRRTPAGIMLSVQDNGVGLPEGLDWRNAPTLGLHLVITLIRQVQGSIELNRAGGTAFEMFIPSAREKTS